MLSFGTSHYQRLGGPQSRLVSLYLTPYQLTQMLKDVDGDCMPSGITLWQLTDVHLDKLKRLYLVDTCRDMGCHDLLHLAHALEVSVQTWVAILSSTVNFGHPSIHSHHSRSLVLDISLLDNMHQKLMKLIPAFPVLRNSHVASGANGKLIGMFLSFLP